jgi:hypothetical protein
MTAEKYTLHVQEPFREALVEDETGLIRNVLLCGNESGNGYSIPAEAFGDVQRARELYEGRPVFLDHNDTPTRPLDRSVREIAGAVRNVTLREGKPYGDIEPTDDDEGRKLRSIVKLKAVRLGMSHTAAYKLNREKKRVERVGEVFTVDVVVNPATTRSFFERVGDEDEVKDEVLQERIDELKAERTSLADKLAAEKLETTRLTGEVSKLDADKATLTAENKRLKEKLDEIEGKLARESRKTEVLGALKDAGLDVEDEAIVSARFVERLVAIDDAAERQAEIDERVALVGVRKPGKDRKSADDRVAYRERNDGRDRGRGNDKPAFDVKETLKSVQSVR